MEKPFIIGITGGSGSGKTTFIDHLRAAFSTEDVCIISQDDYYKTIDLQHIDVNGIHNFDLPKSIDKKAFLNDLTLLMNGIPVEKQEYIFNGADKEANVKVFSPAPVIIVEGLFVFHYKKIKELLDLKIFFYTQENLKIIRRIKRDQIHRNSPLEDVLYRYENHVMPSFKKYIEPYMEEADLVINNNKSFELGFQVISGYLKNKLEK
jgi:uridine kinase